MEILTSIMDKVWIIFIIAAILWVPNNTAEEENNSQDHERQEPQSGIETIWPKVFVLDPDPEYPVVCYSGIKFNSSESGTNKTEKDGKIFSLSSDPEYPVTCRVIHIPANFTDNNETNTSLEEGEGNNGTNLTCIRRDYEKQVSAIFIFKTGPLKLAWNVFNSSKPYGYKTIENLDSIGPVNLLNEMVVDCAKYIFQTDDKGLCASASLCG